MGSIRQKAILSGSTVRAILRLAVTLDGIGKMPGGRGVGGRLLVTMKGLRDVQKFLRWMELLRICPCLTFLFQTFPRLPFSTPIIS